VIYGVNVNGKKLTNDEMTSLRVCWM